MQLTVNEKGFLGANITPTCADANVVSIILGDVVALSIYQSYVYFYYPTNTNIYILNIWSI